METTQAARLVPKRVTSENQPVSEVFPLLWSDDVEAIVEWAIRSLDLVESWRAPGENGRLEHAELLWPGGRISVNVKGTTYAAMGPSGISLRVDDRNRVDVLFARARGAGAEIIQELAESRVAYSFTAVDPDGNQWWVNAETGFLDELRAARSGENQ